MRNLRLFHILFLVIIVNSTFSAINTDSLYKSLNSASDNEKLAIYKQLSAQVAESNPVKYIQYCKEALIIAQNNNDKANEYHFLLLIAKKYRELEMFEKTIEYATSLQQFAETENNKEKLTDVYNELGIAYANIQNFDVSLEYFVKYLEIQEEGLNKENMIIGYGNIAHLYMAKGDYNTSLQFSNKAVDLEIETHDSVSLAYTLNNIALTYKDMNDNAKAWEYFNKAEKITDILGNDILTMHINSNISDLAIEEKKYDKAISYLSENEKLAKKNSSIRLLRETYKFFSDLYVRTNDFRRAYEYHVLFFNLNDSIINNESRKEIYELKILYDTKSNEDKLEILKRDNDIQKIDNHRQEVIIYSLVFITVLIVLLILVLFSKFRTNRINAGLLEEKNRSFEKVNNELKELNTLLESKVKERTTELQSEINDRIKTELALKDALKKAEEANMLKDSFLSNISHEIRTPLNAISGLSSLLNDRFTEERTSEYLKYTDGIQQSSKRLLHLLNNIIDFSMLKSNTYSLDTKVCHVDVIINNAAQLHLFKANEKGLKFNVKIAQPPPEVYVDCENLIKVLSDIIDNSVKYTETGEITITAEKSLRQKEIVISVKDTGVGIESSFLPYIFDSFSQENDSYSKTYQGIGLGLPVAKKMIELMKGRLEISSMKNKGTTVKIFLPEVNYDIINAESGITEELVISNDILKESGIEVLIVEDDEFNALVLSEILTKISNPVIAADGHEALKIIEEYSSMGKKFNVLLVDINLPGNLDGIELLKKIKEKYEDYKNVPFIAQTAYAMSKDREKLLNSGFDDYLAKPVDNEELLAIIKSKLV